LPATQHSAAFDPFLSSFIHLLCRRLALSSTTRKMKYLVEVEAATEAAGPAYRNVQAKDGLLQPRSGLNSCWDIFRTSVEKYPNNRMLGRRRIVDGQAGEYVWTTYKEVYDVVMKLAASISKSGVEQGGRCGIYGANCPEWIISMQACNALGVCCVPLYDSLGAGAVEFVVCHAEVQIVFVEEKKIAELLKTCHATSKYLKTIVSFGGVTNGQKEEASNHGLSIFSWEEFLITGGEHELDLPEKKISDICTIMYTSGTTGDPKGVMISNECLLINIAGTDSVIQSVGEVFDQTDVYLSYLPLAHIFDRMFEEVFISHGSKIGFWRGDVKLLVDDIAELRPTIFCAVPRVLDRIYSGLTAKISSGGILKKTLFNLAYKLKLDSMRKGIKHEKAAPFFDKLVFSKVKERLGGKLRIIVSGGAPLAAPVEEFLRVVTCAHVVQGYGLTETGAGSFASIPNEISMIGTVGPPVRHMDVRLESVPEMGYDALSSIPRGEICVRGNVLFSGYYKREDLTQEVMIDGWFHTGDVGEWQPNGSMKIIDRKKNIFKLSQGEYVAVENLENVYGVLQEIDSIWVYGNSFESYLVAVVNPNQQELERWAAQNGITGSFAELCENSRAKEHILAELAKIAKEKKLKGFEVIKAIHLDPVPFDMERDLITPTYKKKRPQMLKYYQVVGKHDIFKNFQGVIDVLYKSMNKASAASSLPLLPPLSLCLSSEKMKYLVEVEAATETAGPAYRSVLAKGGLLQPHPGLESCWDIFRTAVEKYPNNPMLGRRRVVDGEAGDYTWMTYKEAYDVVMKLAASISKSGVRQGEGCGIYGANCPEWIISMEACNALGVCSVPLYDSLGAGAVEFIVCQAEIQIAFVEEKKVAELLKTCHATSKYLKTIISFGEVTNDHKEEAKKHGISIFSWEEFLIIGGSHDFDLPEKKKSDICTIMYTSGTTGDPKGVMISNESLLVNIVGPDSIVQCVGEVLNENDVYMSYLPLAHVFDRIFEEVFIYHGSKIGFWRGDVRLLVDDIAALSPTVFCAVPRVLDKIYSGLKAKISSGGILKKTLFNFAYKMKLDGMRKGIKHEKAAPFFDKLVFSKVKERLSGKLRAIISGGAPLAVPVEEFLRVVTCAYVLQGYGLTETGGGSIVSIPNDFSMLGTVGPPVPHIDVRLESVPEMGYDALSSIPRGEICIRGSVLFSGYYKREDLVQEVMVNGWFHTGDIGEWQPNGSLKVIDRKKNIFKLSQGEYVAVENLENIYGILPEIDSKFRVLWCFASMRAEERNDGAVIWVYGNSFESSLVAVVNPNQQALEHWAEQNGITRSFTELCRNSRAKEHILAELANFAKEKKLKGFEFIKAIHLDPVPFDMERDLITPTYKKKRPQMLKYYQVRCRTELPSMSSTKASSKISTLQSSQSSSWVPPGLSSCYLNNQYLDDAPHCGCMESH
ncbi:hypothetical protein EJB05_46128, partial [Eragrostis curvula]